jgi:hypothetical protein
MSIEDFALAENLMIGACVCGRTAHASSRARYAKSFASWPSSARTLESHPQLPYSSIA